MDQSNIDFLVQQASADPSLAAKLAKLVQQQQIPDDEEEEDQEEQAVASTTTPNTRTTRQTGKPNPVVKSTKTNGSGAGKLAKGSAMGVKKAGKEVDVTQTKKRARNASESDVEDDGDEEPAAGNSSKGPVNKKLKAIVRASTTASQSQPSKSTPTRTLKPTPKQKQAGKPTKEALEVEEDEGDEEEEEDDDPPPAKSKSKLNRTVKNGRSVSEVEGGLEDQVGLIKKPKDQDLGVVSTWLKANAGWTKRECNVLHDEVRGAIKACKRYIKDGMVWQDVEDPGKTAVKQLVAKACPRVLRYYNHWPVDQVARKYLSDKKKALQKAKEKEEKEKSKKKGKGNRKSASSGGKKVRAEASEDDAELEAEDDDAGAEEAGSDDDD